MLKAESTELVVLIQDGYYCSTVYDKEAKIFTASMGGPFTVTGDKLIVSYAFYTSDQSKAGTTDTLRFQLNENVLILTSSGSAQNYVRIDNGQSSLAGYWLITGRFNNGNMQAITPGVRRTIKLLTGTRFQWIAINSETKEFFGTGGGTYTFVNGKYTEHIEFFSRDSTRVGASLSFDGKVEGNNWHHSGLSSKGEPIHEIWTRGLKL